MKKFIFLPVIALMISCTASRNSVSSERPDYDRSLADSILAYALDHEAVYTLLDTLKPISSVKFLRFNIAKDSSMQDGDAEVVHKDSLLHTIEKYEKVCRALSGGDWQFILVPFKMTEKTTRSLEIYVVRKSRFASILRQYAAFFGQFGFTPAANPAVVLPVIEYENRHDRNRGYGLLFGYPLYAVDFFVSANKTTEKDTTIKLVPRDFFPIPVFAGNRGYFTYAMPKGHQPDATDSVIYKKAVHTLDIYRKEREKYTSPQGLRATDLWRNWHEKK